MAAVWKSVWMTQFKRYCCRSPARVFVTVFLVLIIIGSWYLTSSNPKSELLLSKYAESPRNRYGPHMENKNVQKANSNVHQNRLHADFVPNSHNKPMEDMAKRVTEIRAVQKVSQLEAQQSKISNDKNKQIEVRLGKQEDVQDREKEMKGVEGGEDNKRGNNGEVNSKDEKLNEISEGKETHDSFETTDREHESEAEDLSNETEQKNDEKDIGNSHENQVEQDIKESPGINHKSINKVRPKIYKEGKSIRDQQSPGPAELAIRQEGNQEKESLSADDNTETKGKKRSGRIAQGSYGNNVLIPLVKVSQNSQLIERFKVCVTSICQHTSINLSFHIVADKNSWLAAQEIFDKLEATCQQHFEVKHYNVQQIAKKLQPVTKMLRELFSSGKKSYYDDPIFFLTAAIHEVLPTNMRRVIILDSDLKFRSDIKVLFDMFSQFALTNIIGLAYEQQPTYRNVLYEYRREQHEGTKLGDPPPEGIPGFNSGVVLMNLQNMRQADIYHKLLSRTSIYSVKTMAQKYHFNGHLGDQDFFSLVSFDYRELFYIIPCSWNRQLCRFWEKGYAGVFDAYHRCPKPVHVYHGNCRTPIPND